MSATVETASKGFGWSESREDLYVVHVFTMYKVSIYEWQAKGERPEERGLPLKGAGGIAEATREF